jgi:hypothetical protein
VYESSRKVRPAALIVVAIAIVATLFISLFFGITSAMKNDESYRTAIAHIELSEETRSIVGDIDGFGFFVQGSVSYTGGHGRARYVIRVLGERRTVDVWILLERETGGDWAVVDYRHMDP